MEFNFLTGMSHFQEYILNQKSSLQKAGLG